jgi:cell division protein FtsQ
MPAAARGGSRVQANPRAKAPASSRGKRPPSPKPAPSPGRGGAPGPGLSPKTILFAAGGVIGLALTVTLATGHRGEHIAQAVGRGVDARFAQAGFRLKSVHVQGASSMATADIVRAAGVYADQPLIGLDLQDVRRRVEGVGWVKQARVMRLLPDTLVVAVDERKQLAVWQHDGRTAVIDDHGQVIPEADPGRFASLPLVVGEGAEAAAPGILPILAQRPRLMQRADALVRVDDRRWDLRLKDGSLIQLPATGEEQALMQLEQVDQRSHILELGFDRIDLRNPELVAVRPRQTAAAGRPTAAGA